MNGLHGRLQLCVHRSRKINSRMIKTMYRAGLEASDPENPVDVTSVACIFNTTLQLQLLCGANLIN